MSRAADRRLPRPARRDGSDPARPTVGLLAEEPYRFPQGEQAMLPGGAARPPQSGARRALYRLVFLLLGLTSGFANSFIIVNASSLMGALGADQTEVTWISVAYVMANASLNLLLVRFRTQFGLRLFTVVGLFGFCVVTFVHLFVRDLGSAIFIHMILGVAVAPLTTMTLFYALASVPTAKPAAGVVIGLGLPQLATPLARMFSPELLALDEWRSLYLLEFGLALLCLGAVALVRLPPSERSKAFEPLDFATFALFAGGMALLSAALGLGRLEWWVDRAWIGWALAGSLPLLGGALYIERNRAKPLLDLGFLGQTAVIRFVIVVLMGRIVLSVQSTTAYGLLGTLGVANDELQVFSLLLTLAGAAGIATAALLFTDQRRDLLWISGLIMIAAAALADSRATNLTRPEQMYATQMIIAFATHFYLGPALMKGLGMVFAQGGRPFIAYIVLFAILQSVGALAGGALLGTFQALREAAHFSALVQNLPAFDPLVAGRLQASAASIASIIIDPAQRDALAVQTLGQQVTTEANVLAYNDTFVLVAALAAFTAIYLAIDLVMTRVAARKLSASETRA